MRRNFAAAAKRPQRPEAQREPRQRPARGEDGERVEAELRREGEEQRRDECEREQQARALAARRGRRQCTRSSAAPGRRRTPTRAG